MSSWNMNNDLFTSMFAGGSSYGGMGSIISDYNMIRNGTYKKLMKSYYSTKETETKKTDSTKEESTTDKAAKIDLTETKTAAGKLATAAKDFKSLSSFHLNENDTEEEKTKKMNAAEKVINNYVTAYNSTIDAAKDVDANSVLKKTLGMIADTKSARGVLEDIGITIGADNKLTFSKDVFEKTDATTLNSSLQTLTNGTYSFAGKMMSNANAISRFANAALGSKSTYNSSGAYTRTTANLYESLL